MTIAFSDNPELFFDQRFPNLGSYLELDEQTKSIVDDLIEFMDKEFISNAKIHEAYIVYSEKYGELNIEENKQATLMYDTVNLYRESYPGLALYPLLNNTTKVIIDYFMEQKYKAQMLIKSQENKLAKIECYIKQYGQIDEFSLHKIKKYNSNKIGGKHPKEMSNAELYMTGKIDETMVSETDVVEFKSKYFQIKSNEYTNIENDCDLNKVLVNELRDHHKLINQLESDFIKSPREAEQFLDTLFDDETNDIVEKLDFDSCLRQNLSFNNDYPKILILVLNNKIFDSDTDAVINYIDNQGDFKNMKLEVLKKVTANIDAISSFKNYYHEFEDQLLVLHQSYSSLSFFDLSRPTQELYVDMLETIQWMLKLIQTTCSNKIKIETYKKYNRHLSVVK